MMTFGKTANIHSKIVSLKGGPIKAEVINFFDFEEFYCKGNLIEAKEINLYPAMENFNADEALKDCTVIGEVKVHHKHNN